MISEQFGSLYSKYLSSYFSVINAKNYELYAEINDYLNYNKFRNNLSDNFKLKLSNLLRNPSDENFNYFFENYGAHVLVSAYYGGELKILNSFFSNTLDIKKEFSSKILLEQKLIIDQIKAGKRASFNFKSIFENQLTEINYYFSYEKNGGKDFFSNSLDSIFKNLLKWKNSIQQNKEIIEIPKNGTIPYWEILPNNLDSYYNRNLFKEKYLRFVKKQKWLNEKSLLDKFDIENNIEINYKKVDEKRPYSMTKERITDAYYNDNKIKDKIDLSEKEIKINFLKMYGYNKVIVKIFHQVKEYGNGWQCIAIFNYKDADKDYKNLIVENDSQSHSEDLNPNFSEENCTIGEFDLEKLLNTPYFYIRYRGSGKHDDDWINKDVNITVIFSMR